VDIATIGGIVAGVTLVALSIITGGSPGAFVNIPSVLVTVGGTLAATLISFPLKNVLGVFNIARKAFFHQEKSQIDLIAAIVKYAEKARKEGMLALEEDAENEPDPFLKKGLMLAVDGTETELINRILYNDLTAVQNRHELGQNILLAMGAYAPAFGMIGTLMGLVQMLANMNDPSSIGPGMAVALLTTFYGAFMANVFFLPMAEKLKTRSKEEVQRMELIIEGIMAIKSGDTPRVVEEKLKAFLAPKDRAMLSREKEA